MNISFADSVLNYLCALEAYSLEIEKGKIYMVLPKSKENSQITPYKHLISNRISNIFGYSIMIFLQ